MKAILYGVGGWIARAAATILSIRDLPGRDRLSDEREGRNGRKRERSGVKLDDHHKIQTRDRLVFAGLLVRRSVGQEVRRRRRRRRRRMRL